MMTNPQLLLRVTRYLTLVAVLLLPTVFASAQTDPVVTAKAPVSVEEIFLAKDDGKGEAGEAVTSFQTTDARIYCIVQLSSSSAATVRMNFVAVSVPGVKPDTRVVSTVYTTKDGEDRVNFFGKPKTTWVAGKYRVEIFVDGKVVKELPFDITGPTKAVPVSSFVEPALKPTPKAAPVRKPKKN